MTTGDWAFALVSLTAVLCAVVCGIAWHVAYKEGHQDGRDYERMRNAEARIRAHREEARERLGGRPPWVIEQGPPSMPAVPAPRSSDVQIEIPTDGTFASFLDPMDPEPSRFPGLIESTGELRAVTDLWIGDMERAEQEYRERVATGPQEMIA